MGVLEGRGAGGLLNAPDAWQLIEETERATERGLDPAAILSAASEDHLADVSAATRLLHGSRLYPAGEPLPYPTLIAGLVPATPPATQPDVAAYLDGLAAGMQRRHDTLAAQYRQGPPPPWAHDLGKPPTDHGTRARWADAVASVAVWREAHAVNQDQPLGRPLPPDHRDRVGQARAAMAAAEAVDLAGGKAPEPTQAHLHDARRDPLPAPNPTRESGPVRGR